jgi:hypothetical protein
MQLQPRNQHSLTEAQLSKVKTAKSLSHNKIAELAILPRSYFVARFALTEPELSVWHFCFVFKSLHFFQPVAAGSKTWNVFACSGNGIISSNSTRGMDVCFCYLFVFSCVGSCHESGWSPVKGVLQTMYDIQNFRINSELGTHQKAWSVKVEEEKVI